MNLTISEDKSCIKSSLATYSVIENSIASNASVSGSITIDPLPENSTITVTTFGEGHGGIIYVTNNQTGKAKKYSFIYDSLNRQISETLTELSKRTTRNPNKISDGDYYLSLGRSRKKGKTKRW